MKKHGYDQVFLNIENHMTSSLTASCKECDFVYKIESAPDGVRLIDLDKIAVKHEEHQSALAEYRRGVKFGKSGMYGSFAGSLCFTHTYLSASFIKGFEYGLGRPLDLEWENNGVKDIVTVSW